MKFGDFRRNFGQLAMPAFMAGFVALGAEESSAWRMAMVVPAVLFLCVGTFVWMCCDDWYDFTAALRPFFSLFFR